MPVFIDAIVTEKLRHLVVALVDSNYFATEEAAEKYVQEIYKFIRKIPKLTYRKTANVELNEFFVAYKPNRRTTWYILFTIEHENYFVHNLLNNHSAGYPAFIDSLR